MMKTLFPLVAFNVGWFACVLGGAQGWPILGSLVALAIVTTHISLSARPAQEIQLALFSGLIGVLFESLLAGAGLLSFQSGVILPGTAAIWIVVMWINFAPLLNTAFRFLQGKPILAALVGLAGGPLAYLGGQGLGAVEIHGGIAGLAVIGVIWAISMPLLLQRAASLHAASSGNRSDKSVEGQVA